MAMAIGRGHGLGHCHGHKGYSMAMVIARGQFIHSFVRSLIHSQIARQRTAEQLFVTCVVVLVCLCLVW